MLRSCTTKVGKKKSPLIFDMRQHNYFPSTDGMRQRSFQNETFRNGINSESQGKLVHSPQLLPLSPLFADFIFDIAALTAASLFIIADIFQLRKVI